MLAKQRRMSDTNTKQKGSRFSVSGDKYKSPVYMNPLLRTSTQYSQVGPREEIYRVVKRRVEFLASQKFSFALHSHMKL